MDTFIDSSWYWYRYLSPEKAGGPIDRALVERVDAGRPVHRRRRARGHAPAVRPRVDEDDARRRPGRAGRAVQAAVQPGPDPRPRRRADVEVARQHRRPRRPRRPLRRRHRPAVPDVHGPVGPGRAVEPDRDRWRPSLPEPASGRWPSTRTGASRATPIPARCRPARARPTRRPPIRAAAHRTLRDVTADYEAFHFNTMIAKLMELANTLFRYRGTVVAGTPAWDEAIRLLLLMLAPAAPHITEELWSRRLAAAGQPWVVDPHRRRGRRSIRRAVVESTREIPVQVNGKLRDKVVVAADASAADIEAAVLARDKIKAILDGRAPGPDRRGRRRQARQPRRPVTSDDAARVRPPPRCDRAGRRRHRASAAPDRARGLPRTPSRRSTRLTGCWPSAPADRCATSRSRSSRTRPT